MSNSNINAIYPIDILRGDYPDPSIVRVGQDYYMTHSSFMYAPGLLVWHSRNLSDWVPLCHALQTYAGDIWAPDLVYVNGLFYHIRIYKFSSLSKEKILIGDKTYILTRSPIFERPR
jgi:xylan 1,4-beta-xylosidase